MPRLRAASTIALGVLMAGCVGFSPGGGGGATAVMAAARPTGQMVSLNAVVIRDSGSTNAYGYTIVLGPDGHATCSSGKGRTSGTVPAWLARKLYGEVGHAQPLDRLPVGHCMKSVSFGSSITVWNQGRTSPDLSCPANAAQRTLLADLRDVARRLNIAEVPRMAGSPPPPLPIL